MNQIHGSCVAIGGRGIVLRGPSGSGKSDLALRLIDGGADLVADDRIELSVRGGRLIAASPPTISGLLEARGIGILCLEAVAEAPVCLVVDLVPPEQVDRLPQPSSATIEGVALPLARLAAFEASSPAKVRMALDVASGRKELRQ